MLKDSNFKQFTLANKDLFFPQYFALSTLLKRDEMLASNPDNTQHRHRNIVY